MARGGAGAILVRVVAAQCMASGGAPIMVRLPDLKVWQWHSGLQQNSSPGQVDVSLVNGRSPETAGGRQECVSLRSVRAEVRVSAL